MHQGAAGPTDPADHGHGLALSFEDVDRILSRDAGTGASRADSLRDRRDELTAALTALVAAAQILAADVAVLRHCLRPASGAPRTGADEGRRLVADLPPVLSARPWGRGWSAPTHRDDADEPEDAILLRAGPLMTAHRAMARTDLDSNTAVRATLELVETQLIAVTERRNAVDARLTQVRAAIVEEWSARMAPSLDTPA